MQSFLGVFVAKVVLENKQLPSFLSHTKATCTFITSSTLSGQRYRSRKAPIMVAAFHYHPPIFPHSAVIREKENLAYCCVGSSNRETPAEIKEKSNDFCVFKTFFELKKMDILWWDYYFALSMCWRWCSATTIQMFSSISVQPFCDKIPHLCRIDFKLFSCSFFFSLQLV